MALHVLETKGSQFIETRLSCYKFLNVTVAYSNHDSRNYLVQNLTQIKINYRNVCPEEIKAFRVESSLIIPTMATFSSAVQALLHMHKLYAGATDI